MRERLAGRGNEDGAQRGAGGNAPLESGGKKGRNTAFRERQRGRRKRVFGERQREREAEMRL